MRKANMEFQDFELTVFPELKVEKDVQAVKTITFQVTEECSLRCTYCYQGCKKPTYMKFDEAKDFIDYLFEHRLDESALINEYNTKAIVFEFIGGEPLLNMPVVNQITEYIDRKLFDNPDCIWLLHHAFSFSTNGIAYFTDDVQKYLQRYDSRVSMSVTIDGCKELHDMCRKFPDGSPSYDIAIKAALAEKKRGFKGTKITLSPDNISYVYEGVKNMIELGFNEVMINPVYEEGWQLEHAQTAYAEYKKIADYVKENNLDEFIYLRLFDASNYHNTYYTDSADGNKNWCGSNCAMLALDYKGDIYPCIRFMESSLNSEAEPYIVGDTKHGIAQLPEHKERLDTLYTLTKDNQSEQKCLDCPIESGCSWCTGYHLQHFGTVFKRATYICNMHKAAALASLYYYKIVGNKEDYDKIKITKELALEIISEDEWLSLQWEE